MCSMFAHVSNEASISVALLHPRTIALYVLDIVLGQPTQSGTCVWAKLTVMDVICTSMVPFEVCVLCTLQQAFDSI